MLLGTHLQFAQSFGLESGCEWARVRSASECERVGARNSGSPVVLPCPRRTVDPGSAAGSLPPG